MKTSIITTRTRNLGYAWTIDVEDPAHEYALTRPDHVGTVKAIRAAMVERLRSIGDGTYYYDCLFVGGVPMLSRADGGPSIHDVLNEVESTGSAVVPLDPPLTPGEAAQLLGVTRRTVIDWAAAGRFPGAWRTAGSDKRGGNWRMPRASVLNLR